LASRSPRTDVRGVDSVQNPASARSNARVVGAGEAVGRQLDADPRAAEPEFGKDRAQLERGIGALGVVPDAERRS
jgi:hypothetical protein